MDRSAIDRTAVRVPPLVRAAHAVRSAAVAPIGEPIRRRNRICGRTGRPVSHAASIEGTARPGGRRRRIGSRRRTERSRRIGARHLPVPRSAARAGNSAAAPSRRRRNARRRHDRDRRRRGDIARPRRPHGAEHRRPPAVGRALERAGGRSHGLLRIVVCTAPFRLGRSCVGRRRAISLRSRAPARVVRSLSRPEGAAGRRGIQVKYRFGTGGLDRQDEGRIASGTGDAGIAGSARAAPGTRLHRLVAGSRRVDRRAAGSEGRYCFVRVAQTCADSGSARR